MQTPREFKTTAYAQLARVGKTVASGPRIELLDLLSQGPRSVEELANEVGQSVANTSHHLQVLRRARLVGSTRSGVFVTYQLADSSVLALLRALRGVAEARLLELDEATSAFLAARDLGEPIDAEELRLRQGEVTLLDVRPAAEFGAGHLAGSVSMPVEELRARLEEIPRERMIVAYCRGKYCVMALDAVALLRAAGFDAVHLDVGPADWQASGLAVGAP